MRARKEDGVNYVTERSLFIEKEGKPKDVHIRQVLPRDTLPNNKNLKNYKARKSKQRK